MYDCFHNAWMVRGVEQHKGFFIDSTRVLYVCAYCGHARSMSIDGLWTREDLDCVPLTLKPHMVPNG